MANPIMEFIDEVMALRRKASRLEDIERELRRTQEQCVGYLQEFRRLREMIDNLYAANESRSTDNEF